RCTRLQQRNTRQPFLPSVVVDRPVDTHDFFLRSAPFLIRRKAGSRGRVDLPENSFPLLRTMSVRKEPYLAAMSLFRDSRRGSSFRRRTYDTVQTHFSLA